MRSFYSWIPFVVPIAGTVGAVQAEQAIAAPPAGHSAFSRSAEPNAFGSIALPLGANRFTARWLRVASTGGTPRLGSIVSQARSLGPVRQAQFVNAALNRRIKYRADFGDHWATVGETLSRSAGDCEDYAIAKMQALRALGIPSSDLFMTFGRLGSFGPIHSVLVMRASGRFWILDNRIDRLVPNEEFGGFYPIISFSAGGRSWLHGYARGKMPLSLDALDHALAQRSGSDRFRRRRQRS